jgi:hypothetical protein
MIRGWTVVPMDARLRVQTVCGSLPTHDGPPSGSLDPIDAHLGDPEGVAGEHVASCPWMTPTHWRPLW